MAYLSVYKASAGSGKTTELTTRFISLALKGDFRNILAVTFTNKATNELKERVIKRLYEYAEGKKDFHFDILLTETGLSPEQFKLKCGEVLHRILYNYGMFSISTIDSFFQRIIKSFSREIGVQANVTVELDSAEVMNQAFEMVIADAGNNQKPELTEWLSKYARQRIEDGNNNNLASSMTALGKELFKEEFKLRKKALVEGFSYEKLVAFQQTIQKMISDYENNLKRTGQRLVDLMAEKGLVPNDLINGLPGMINDLQKGVDPDMKGKRRIAAMEDPENWATKSSSHRQEIIDLASESLLPEMEDYLKYKNSEGLVYRTVLAIKANFSVFGIIAEILDKIRIYKEEEDIILLSDSAEFLKDIIEGYESPFIYEKVGTQYHHYLIDEFQDTSLLQWNNFRPLVQNAMSEGKENIIVGDVKQSIYRWRGGDWSLLDHKVQEELKQPESRNLDKNYRSSKNVVDFNNGFFKSALVKVKNMLTEQYGEGVPAEWIQKQQKRVEHAYESYEQKFPEEKSGDSIKGYVEVSFLPGKNRQEYNETLLQKMTSKIEELQLSGVAAAEIAVLVRGNADAVLLASHLLHYSGSDQAKPGVNYQVVSSDALKIVGSPAVLMIVNALKILNEPNSDHHKIALISDWYKLKNDTEEIEGLFRVHPLHHGEYTELIDEILNMPKLVSIDLMEELIRILNLSDYQEQWPFILTFLDAVSEISARGKGDIASLLDWWEIKGKELEVVISEQVDAINVLTIHKAKGLEYKIVFVPFCNWEMFKGGNLKWLSLPVSPFNTFSSFPINMKEDLKDSLFAEDFLGEVCDQFVDNLNLLYVAFTRAREGLYVYTDAEFKKSRVGLLLQDLMSESGVPFSLGEEQYSEKNKNEEKEAEKRSYQGRVLSSEWQSRIRLSSNELIKLDAEIYEKLIQGRKIHEVMELLKPDFSPQELLAEIQKEWNFSPEELDHLMHVLAQLKTNVISAGWFQEGNRFFAETNLLTGTGNTKRPDLMIEKPDAWVVVDYKSGEEKESYQAQVKTYCELLGSIEKKKVEGFIVYLQPFSIKRVEL